MLFGVLPDGTAALERGRRRRTSRLRLRKCRKQFRRIVRDAARQDVPQDMALDPLQDRRGSFDGPGFAVFLRDPADPVILRDMVAQQIKESTVESGVRGEFFDDIFR